MSEPFEIDLGIDKLLPATAAFRTIGEQLDALADRFDALVDKISAITSQATAAAAALKSTGTTRSSSGSGGSSGGGGASGNGGSGQKEPKLLIAQYQQLEAAQKNLDNALQHSTDAQLADAELILKKRQEAVDKLTAQVAPEAVKLFSGPHQNLERERTNLKAAEASGDDKQKADAKLRVERAEQALLRATGSNNLPEPKDPKLLVAEYQRLLDAQENLINAQKKGDPVGLRDAERILRLREEAVEKLTEMAAPEAVKLFGGPHQELAKAKANLEAARTGGDADQIKDAGVKYQKALEALDRLYGDKQKLFNGPNQRLDEARSNLEAAKQGGTEKQVADAELRVRRAEQELARATGAEKPFSVRSGPHQKLLDIQEQMGKLDQISDPARREAARKDLDREMWNARRAVQLHEQKQQDPNSLLVPGLLSNFQTLNRLMTRVMDGNVIGAAFSIGTLLRQHAAGGPSVGEILSGRLRQGADGGYMWGGANTASGATGKMGAGEAIEGAAGMNFAAKGFAKAKDFLFAPAGRQGPTLSGRALAPGLLSEVTMPMMLAGAVIAGELLLVGYGLKKLFDAASEAAISINSYAKAAAVTGSTYGTTMGLEAMGLSADTITNVAEQFRQTITGGGDKFAMMTAAKYGLGPLPPVGTGDNADTAALLEDAIKKLAAIPDMQERSIAVRNLHLQAIDPEIERYTRMGPTMDKDMETRRIQAGDYSNVSQEKADQDARMNYLFQTMSRHFSSMFIPMEVGAEKLFNKFLNWAEQPFFGGDGKDKLEKAATKIDHAGDKMSKAAAQFNEGITGGGDRARGAIPPSLQGEMLRNAIEGKSLRAGAFTL